VLDQLQQVREESKEVVPLFGRNQDHGRLEDLYQLEGHDFLDLERQNGSSVLL
jgi:hypothetical protein